MQACYTYRARVTVGSFSIPIYWYQWYIYISHARTPRNYCRRTSARVKVSRESVPNPASFALTSCAKEKRRRPAQVLGWPAKAPQRATHGTAVLGTRAQHCIHPRSMRMSLFPHSRLLNLEVTREGAYHGKIERVRERESKRVRENAHARDRQRRRQRQRQRQ